MAGETIRLSAETVLEKIRETRGPWRVFDKGEIRHRRKTFRTRGSDIPKCPISAAGLAPTNSQAFLVNREVATAADVRDPMDPEHRRLRKLILEACGLGR